MEDFGRSTAKVLSALRFAKEYFTLVNSNLRISTLHPGGGQYDCFSICDENSPLVMINYNGTSIAGSGIDFQDAWRMIQADPGAMAKRFCDALQKSDMEQELRRAPDSRASAQLVHIVDKFIEKIGAELDQNWNLDWGYLDSPYEVDQNLSQAILVPESWKEIPSLSPDMYGWQANVLVLTKNRKIVAVANQATGEILG